MNVYLRAAKKVFLGRRYSCDAISDVVEEDTGKWPSYENFEPFGANYARIFAPMDGMTRGTCER